MPSASRLLVFAFWRAIMAYAILIFSAEGSWVVVPAAAGIIGGVYLFLTGFRLLRVKRTILNTPLSRIRSASIGLVEVTGTAVGPHAVTAPLSGQPCFYYRVRAWQWVESDDNKRWKLALDDSIFMPFFLEDSTGRVLVNPQGAEMELHKSFSDEVGASLFYAKDLMPPNMRNFLILHGLIPQERMKLEEQIIPEGYPLFVFGTLGENTDSSSFMPTQDLRSGVQASLVMGSGAASFSLKLGNSENKMANAVATAATQRVNLIPGMKMEAGKATAQISRGSSSFAARAAGVGGAPSGTGNAVATANTTVATAQGTSSETTSPAHADFDQHASTAISKGERNQPFMISFHSQKELAGKLAWKSIACIWGGPAVVLICVYFLLEILA